jgi:hypothetical protein
MKPTVLVTAWSPGATRSASENSVPGISPPTALNSSTAA